MSDTSTQQLKNENNKNKAVYWDCICKRCGKEFSTSSQNLTKIKSCGCSRRYRDAEKEIGWKYNRLTVLEIDRDRTDAEYTQGKQLGVFYKFQCDCGNIRTYRMNAVKFGHIKSCGCSRFNNPLRITDLTGQTFGRLTVVGRDIERDGKDYKNQDLHGGVHWLCQCACGNPNLTSVTAYCLKNGHTQSCGCYASERIAERNKTYSIKINPIFVNQSDVEEFIADGTVRLYEDNLQRSCIVDLEDYYYIKNWYWAERTKKYWVTNAKLEDEDKYNKSTLRLHQIIAERKYGEYDSNLMPDHLSRNHADNRRCNLILKTNAGNMKNRNLSRANTSGKTGVSYNNQKQMYTAYITVNYKTTFLGDYINYDDAVAARLKAEKEYGFTCDDIYPEFDTNNRCESNISRGTSSVV